MICELNRCHAEGSPEEFREALREWTRGRMEAGAEKAAKESVFEVHDYEGEEDNASADAR